MVSSPNNQSSVGNCYKLGIVGLGPKGLFALERFLAEIKDREITSFIELHIYNQNPFFGSGNVYRSDQPNYLIMNYANKNIDIWCREKPDAVVDGALNFSDWIAQRTGAPVSINTDKFSSRALVGTYLEKAFLRLRESSPKNIFWHTHIATVTNIIKVGKQFTIETDIDTSSKISNFDVVLLTTGHLGAGAKFDEKVTKSHYIDFIYPTRSKLLSISKLSSIAIQGFGLTCIDAILEVTEGRGGVFKVTSENNYAYERSAKEPTCIYPFSRTGLPMFPRSGAGDDINSLFFFTNENIAATKSPTGVSFLKTLLPLIKKECYFRYYSVLFKNRNRKLKYHHDFQNIVAQVRQFHIDFTSEEKFDWCKIIDPFLNQQYISHTEMVNYITYLISEAKKGPKESALMAAVGTWRTISPVFNKIYSFGRLDAESHKLFDEQYFGLFNRIAYGPPIENMQKILALAKAGIICFDMIRNPQLIELKETGEYQLFYLQKHSKKTLKKVHIHTLINARIPRSSIPSNNTLYHNLIKDGLLRIFCNTNGGNYISKGIDIDFKGRGRDINGNAQAGLSLYGTPTEGVTYDNDTLSRRRNNFASQWAKDVILNIQNKATKEKAIE
ncbi:FAD-NAD(P)-binding [Salegentibacter echinorum]|uniref:FAD-NAD(P)-binding n=1 Tax=Salegentibacter echinorum TaxID=1073325 RepID=A0A1M5KDU6_SALEC|nr:FAD/NAD(P)-binding protein [Salegentibacter echinorum]SHG50780.1 FAD-NAD(P)-binding [Salegentibacter echinorum]